MSKTTLAAGAAIALTLLVGGAALAQQVDRPDHGLRADADRDGRISRTEFVDRRVAGLNAIDANRDGSVSVEERQSGIDTRRNQRVSARFETLDRDGNDAISREEFTSDHPMRADRAGRGGRHAMGGRGHRGRGGGEWGTGRRAAGPVSIAEVQARTTARFDRIDADRDGFITVEERRAVREAMRDQRRERRAGRSSPSAPASE